MTILTIKLNTEDGKISYDYPDAETEPEAPSLVINASSTGYVNGEKYVVSGWNLQVQIGDHPEERERSKHITRLLQWRERQRDALAQALDEDGVSTLDPSLRSRVEGAVAMCDALLGEMGHKDSQ